MEERKDRKEKITNEINTKSITTPVYSVYGLDVYQFRVCGCDGGGRGGCGGVGVAAVVASLVVRCGYCGCVCIVVVVAAAAALV